MQNEGLQWCTKFTTYNVDVHYYIWEHTGCFFLAWIESVHPISLPFGHMPSLGIFNSWWRHEKRFTAIITFRKSNKNSQVLHQMMTTTSKDIFNDKKLVFVCDKSMLWDFNKHQAVNKAHCCTVCINRGGNFSALAVSLVCFYSTFCRLLS